MLIAFSYVCLLAACGGGSGGETENVDSPSETIQPDIITVTPQPDTIVPPNEVITPTPVLNPEFANTQLSSMLEHPVFGRDIMADQQIDFSQALLVYKHPKNAGFQNSELFIKYLVAPDDFSTPQTLLRVCVDGTVQSDANHFKCNIYNGTVNIERSVKGDVTFYNGSFKSDLHSFEYQYAGKRGEKIELFYKSSEQAVFITKNNFLPTNNHIYSYTSAGEKYQIFGLVQSVSKDNWCIEKRSVTIKVDKEYQLQLPDVDHCQGELINSFPFNDSTPKYAKISVKQDTKLTLVADINQQKAEIIAVNNRQKATATATATASINNIDNELAIIEFDLSTGEYIIDLRKFSSDYNEYLFNFYGDSSVLDIQIMSLKEGNHQPFYSFDANHPGLYKIDIVVTQAGQYHFFQDSRQTSQPVDWVKLVDESHQRVANYVLQPGQYQLLVAVNREQPALTT